MSKLWPKIVIFLPQKPLKPSSCNSFCWRLGSERMYLLLFGYMMGHGLEVLLMTRFCMLQKDMSDNSFSPTLTSPSVFSRSPACTRIGRLSSRLAHPHSHPPLFGKCALSTRRGWRKRKVTRLFPVAKFCHRQASERKLPGYIDRINKRARTCRR